jgi:arginine-tRNA-protein transferase
VSIRIPTQDFRPSRSQRRARRDCAHLRIAIGPPQVTEDRIALYHAWHRFRERERDWEASALDVETYAAQFAFPHPCSREVAFYEERPGLPPRLVGVGLCDETPSAWSAIFFFYHPDLADAGLGTANVVAQIEIARARGISHVYLGYRVEECPSLQYKSNFRPHEPEGRPALRSRHGGCGPVSGPRLAGRAPVWQTGVRLSESAREAATPDPLLFGPGRGSG